MGHLAVRAQTGNAGQSNAPCSTSGGNLGQYGEAASVVALPGIAEALQRICRTETRRKDEAVYEAGMAADSIYRVAYGTLRVVQLLPDGRRTISTFLNPGDFFGFSELDEHMTSVEAITDCGLTRYPRRQFEAILQSQADAGHQIFRLMCHQIAVTNRMLLLLGRKTAAERLASFLRVMVAPGKFRQGMEIYLPMTRADIADHLGLTIETVSRTVTQFRQRKLIESCERNQIRILDPESLEFLAGE